MKKTNYKAPNNSKLQQISTAFVQQEINKKIGEMDGGDVCLAIGILQDQMLPLYRRYGEMISSIGISLSDLPAYFGDNWSRLSNGQKRTVEAAIRREVEATNKQVAGHIKYLEMARMQIETLGPRGQKALAALKAELLGWGEVDEPGQEEGVAA